MFCIYSFFYEYCITCLYPSPSCHHFNNIWRCAQMMKLVTVRFSPVSCYAFPLHDVVSNSMYMDKLTTTTSRAAGQAISLWLPTEAARVRAQGKSCGICSGQSGIGAGFRRVFRFPLPVIPSINCSTITTIYYHPELVQ
jgi:hypothetical protein